MAEVTVSGDIITSGVTADMLWTAESAAQALSFNDNKYLHAAARQTTFLQ